MFECGRALKEMHLPSTEINLITILGHTTDPTTGIVCQVLSVLDPSLLLLLFLVLLFKGSHHLVFVEVLLEEHESVIGDRAHNLLDSKLQSLGFFGGPQLG